MSLDVGSYSSTSLPDFVIVGKYSSIARDVRFYEIHDQHKCIIDRKCVFTTNWEQPGEKGTILIGNDTWIGEDCKIFANSTIGNGCIIGAGTVFHGDIPDYAVVYGNPGKIRRFRFTPEQIEKLQKIKWWDWSDDLINQRKADLRNIDLFLEKYG